MSREKVSFISPGDARYNHEAKQWEGDLRYNKETSEYDYFYPDDPPPELRQDYGKDREAKT